MAGAWTAQVARMAGADAAVRHTHVEAFVTEPVALPLNNTVELANFYETILGKERAVSVGFSRDAHGSLVVTEAVFRTAELHRRSSAWGLAATAADLLRLYPALAGVRVVRGWAIPTPDQPRRTSRWWAGCRARQPVRGRRFMETITTVPLICDWMAGMILGEAPPADLGLFAPGAVRRERLERWHVGTFAVERSHVRTTDFRKDEQCHDKFAFAPPDRQPDGDCHAWMASRSEAYPGETVATLCCWLSAGRPSGTPTIFTHPAACSAAWGSASTAW